MRRVIAIASAVSLLMCAMIIGAWLFLPRGRKFTLNSAHHRYEFVSSTGDWVIAVWGGARTSNGVLWSGPGKHWDGTWANPTHRLPLGFFYGKAPDNDPTAAGYLGLVIPSWALIILFSLLPAFWFYQWWFHPPRLPGKCTACGYDLRATPDRCPECGTVPPEKIKNSD